MKGVRNPLTDWNIRVLFLRSKSTPRLYFLSKRSRYLRNAGSAIPYDSVKLANELLRIDLNSFFTEMASWYLYYRKQRPTYTIVERDNRFPHRRKLGTDGHVAFHKRARLWRKLEATPYVDEVEGFKFKSLTFLTCEEYSRWRSTLPPLSTDFDSAITKALERSSKGSISTQTKELLADACSICLNSRSNEVPDPLYYSYLFQNIAVECTEINELFSAVCFDRSLARQYGATELFGSYLNLEEHGSRRIERDNYFELVEEPTTSVFSPSSGFLNYFSHRSSFWLASHDLDYLQSLYAVALQVCIDIPEAHTISSEGAALQDLEKQLIHAYIDISNTELKEMLYDLDSVINLCANLLHLPGIRKVAKNSAEALNTLLNELKTLRDTDYFHSLASLSNGPTQKSANNNPGGKMAELEEERHRFFRLYSAAAGTLNRSLVQQSKPSDRQGFFKQIKRHAIIRYAENTCLQETEWSFSKFYARLLNELLCCDKLPVKCKKCGSLFFPTGQNSKYCDRFDSSTNLYCNPRINEKHKLGRKTPHGTAINLHKKAETAKQLNEKKRLAYFIELEEFVDHEIGPIYFKSTLISDELYDAWRTAVNTPKNQPKTKTPENLGFPRPVIWETKLIDGNQKIAVYLNQHAHPLLRKKLNQLAGSSKSICSVIDNPRIPYGGWILSVFDLLRSIVSANSNVKLIQDGPIPVPGLGQMVSFIPKDNPQAMPSRKGSRTLQFPLAGEQSKILFELLD